MEPADSGIHKVNETMTIVLYVAAICFVVFTLFYLLLLAISPTFRAMKTIEKQDYISRVLGVLHAVIVVTAAYLTMYKLCEDPTTTVFSSVQCINKPRRLVYHSVQLSLGFFFYDFLLCFVIMRDFSALGFQMLCHHIVAIISFSYVLLVKPQFTMYIVTMNQFTEISTPFLHLR